MYCILTALGAAGLAILEALGLLGLWTGTAADLVFSGTAFAMALTLGRVSDGLRHTRAPLGKRAVSAWSVAAMSLLGALRLPLGSELGWRLSLGMERGDVRAAALAAALLGLAAWTLAIPAGKGRPPRRAALFLGGAVLLCLAVGILRRCLGLPAMIEAWAGVAGLLLTAALSVLAGAGKGNSSPPV